MLGQQGGDLNSSLSAIAAPPAEARRGSGTKPAVRKEGGLAVAGGLAYFWVCLGAEDRGGEPAAIARGLAHFSAWLIAGGQGENALVAIRKEEGLAIAGICLVAEGQGGAPTAAPRGLAHLEA